MKCVTILMALFVSSFSLAALKANKVVDLEDVVWGFDFINEKEFIASTRSGKVFHFNLDSKVKSEIKNVPQTKEIGQGGLMDLRLHPDFEKNSLVYISYTKVQDGKNTTVFSRFKIDLKNKKFEAPQVLLEAKAWSSNTQHFGSRIVFDRKGYIYLSMGERNEREKAQLLDNHFGKVLRLHDDGRVPKDNPFVAQAGALPEIFSYGHRNPQGMFWNSKTSQLFLSEHGPRGGDEINIVSAGKNYGWPVITYGKEYISGRPIGEGTKKEGMEQPLHQYTPSIGISGMIIYSGKKLKTYGGDIFAGGLALRYLSRVTLKNGKFNKEEKLFKKLRERVRNVGESPDGSIYFSTDSGGIYSITV